MWQHKQKWRHLSVWIIDEISMVSAELLEYLEQTIRRMRTKQEDLPGKPFGGLQV
jgi:ATP-dependent exoDNAse (exonuclease V) alpha subunit